MKTVVFFPYRAVCWDILESVWAAACRDDRYDVKVVPLPWYSWEKRGSEIEAHYEAELFPKYVPIIHYKDFVWSDIDIAVSDNPYDGNNDLFVTDKSYWSHELKKHVKKLVIIPQFGFGVKDISARLKNCAADIYIAESEKQGELYRKILPDKEIYVLGNPKFDMLFGDVEMTEAWGSMFTDKTVFFLNMSINLFYANPKRYMKKLDEIIRYFALGQYGLIWRPHPSTEAAVERISPQHLALYRELIQLAADSENIVYDTTRSPYVAMKIADAYIGDESSILFQQFALTGKPVYVVRADCDFAFDEMFYDLYHLEIGTKDNTDNTRVFSGFDDVYVTSHNANGLYKLNLNNGETELQGQTPGERNIEQLYLSLRKFADYLLLCPYRANEWAVYNIKSKTWIKQERFEKQYAVADKLRHGFFFSAETERYIYLIPTDVSVFARFDKQALSFETFDGWYEEFRSLCPKDAGLYPIFATAFKPIVAGNKVWLCSPLTNYICAFDMNACKPSWHKAGDSDLRYFGIAYDGLDFWLYGSRWVDGTENFVLVRWNKETGGTKEWAIQKIEYFSEDSPRCPFHHIIYSAGYVWLAPWYCKHNVRFDPKTETFEIFLFGNEEKIYNKWPDKTKVRGINVTWPTYCYGNIIGGYSFPNFGETSYDLEKREFIYNNEIKWDRLDELLKTRESDIDGLWYENMNFTVTGFVKHVIDRKGVFFQPVQDYVIDQYKLVNADGTCGEKIWQSIS